jgi:competence protein ComEC
MSSLVAPSQAIAEVSMRGRLSIATSAFESWLEQERDQIPLWLPVGLGLGISGWHLMGNAAWPVVVLACIALLMFGFAVGVRSRIGSLLLAIAVLSLSGFGVISAKSAIHGQLPLEKMWIGQFYGLVKVVEPVSARGIVRLELETGGHAGLPSRVRVNLKNEQYRPEYVAGAILNVRARLMPPPGPALPH